MQGKKVEREWMNECGEKWMNAWGRNRKNKRQKESEWIKDDNQIKK